MFSNQRFPALIVSTPRSGSTALALAYYNNTPAVKLFNELSSPEESTEFEKYSKKNQQYVLKIHLHDLLISSEYIQQLAHTPNIFKIRIRRRDIIKQIASIYTASERRRFLYPTHRPDNYSVDIEVETVRISYMVQFVKEINYAMENTDIMFDLDVWYEDLLVAETVYKRTPRPPQYQELLEEIKRIL
jgi:hypothetical protein